MRRAKRRLQLFDRLSARFTRRRWGSKGKIAARRRQQRAPGEKRLRQVALALAGDARASSAPSIGTNGCCSGGSVRSH